MSNKELRKLSRAELLELLIEQGRENLAQEEQLKAAREELDSRQLKIDNCGSIAEAALQLSGVFEAAQAAIDQYRQACEKRCADMLAECEKQCAEKIEACEKQCAALTAEAERKAEVNANPSGNTRKGGRKK